MNDFSLPAHYSPPLRYTLVSYSELSVDICHLLVSHPSLPPPTPAQSLSLLSHQVTSHGKLIRLGGFQLKALLSPEASLLNIGAWSSCVLYYW